jgi:ABC-2 type transport system ATP-binding protein
MSESPAAPAAAPASPDAPVVSLREVTRTFGRVVALDRVTLDLPPGAVGLLGPNGAGKSTMLKVILGLLPPTSGSLSVLGIDPVRDPLEARRRVGYMPEQDAYVTGLTGVESVAYAGVLSGLPRTASMQRAHTVLNYVGLDEVRYRKVEEYSTGMRQRVRLAQALVHDPELLFLDEPTNGLDPEGREEILEVVRDLAKNRGKRVVLCSHLLRDVERVCDRVILLSQGRVARTGTMAEVRGGRKDWLRVTGRGAPEPFEEALRAAGCTVARGAGHLLVGVPAGSGSAPVFRAAASLPWDLRSVAPEEVSLEDVFVEAVASGEVA